jgi:hypothetical protein
MKPLEFPKQVIDNLSQINCLRNCCFLIGSQDSISLWHSTFLKHCFPNCYWIRYTGVFYFLNLSNSITVGVSWRYILKKEFEIYKEKLEREQKAMRKLG